LANVREADKEGWIGFSRLPIHIVAFGEMSWYQMAIYLLEEFPGVKNPNSNTLFAETSVDPSLVEIDWPGFRVSVVAAWERKQREEIRERKRGKEEESIVRFTSCELEGDSGEREVLFVKKAA
jgi:hypothetical protein